MDRYWSLKFSSFFITATRMNNFWLRPVEDSIQLRLKSVLNLIFSQTLSRDFRKKGFSSPRLRVLVSSCFKIVFLILLKGFEPRRHGGKRPKSQRLIFNCIVLCAVAPLRDFFTFEPQFIRTRRGFSPTYKSGMKKLLYNNSHLLCIGQHGLFQSHIHGYSRQVQRTQHFNRCI